MPDFTVIFVEPENAGNVGALARVMANFGLRKLILVNPQCELGSEARGRAKHALPVLDKARNVRNLGAALEGIDFAVATTGKLPPDYEASRAAVAVSEISERISAIKGNVALVFGRESIGLLNEELDKCDIVVNIPTDRACPVLNISHAAAIIFYELCSGKSTRFSMAGKAEREVLFRHFDSIIDDLDGVRQKQMVKRIFRSVVNRSIVMTRETSALACALSEMKKKTKAS
jgi:TrmH family RNA methyltransferase